MFKVRIGYGLLSVCITVACSDDSSDVDRGGSSGSGGQYGAGSRGGEEVGGTRSASSVSASGRSGETSLVSGGGAGIGGASEMVPVTGGANALPAKGGGTAGTSNATAGAINATAGTSSGPGNPDTSTCPAWPQAKVMPIIGPFFYGPDPGPCSSRSSKSGVSTVSNFVYESGVLLSVETGTSVKRLNWSQGILRGLDYLSGAQVVATVQYEWSINSIIETTSDGQVGRTELSPAGYPTAQWAAAAGSLNWELSATFDYADCRLVRRTVKKADGTDSSSLSGQYEYDANGHLVARRAPNGDSETYTYGCW